MKPVIETNIPLPTGHIYKTGEPKYPFADLKEPGQSFLWECTEIRDAERVRVYANIYGRRHGLQFTTQKDDAGNVRVWLKAIKPEAATKAKYGTKPMTVRLKNLEVGQYIDEPCNPPQPGGIRTRVWMVSRQTNRSFKNKQMQTTTGAYFLRITRTE